MLAVHTTKGSPVIVLGGATWRLYSDSPRDDAIIFGDLDGKLHTLRVERSTCTRAGQYWIARLIEQRRRDVPAGHPHEGPFPRTFTSKLPCQRPDLVPIPSAGGGFFFRVQLPASKQLGNNAAIERNHIQ
jgi:hypothetical protein